MPPIYPIAGFAALVARDKDMKEYIGGEVIKSQQRRDELEQFSRMEDFEARLWKYLTEGERTKAQLLEPINTSIAELNEQRKLLEEQKELLEGKESSEELIKQKEFLEQKIEDLQKEKKQVVNPLSMKISTIIKESNEDIKAQCINIENRIKAEIEPIEDVEELNLYAQMQDSSIESSSQNFYGGLYTRYNALVGVAPASKTNSQKDWFVYDGISGGKVMLKLNKQYR